jgi:hypothetical protein
MGEIDEEEGGGVEELPLNRLNVARRHKRKGGVGAKDGWLLENEKALGGCW